MGRITGLIVTPANPPKVFTCPQCGKEYKTEDGLNKHVEKEHVTGSQEKPKESPSGTQKTTSGPDVFYKPNSKQEDSL